MNIDAIKAVYFVGAGGIGMSAIARYYNTKGILNADSVDIRNLMLPLDKWGMTDNLPDTP